MTIKTFFQSIVKYVKNVFRRRPAPVVKINKKNIRNLMRGKVTPAKLAKLKILLKTVTEVDDSMLNAREKVMYDNARMKVKKYIKKHEGRIKICDGASEKKKAEKNKKKSSKRRNKNDIDLCKKIKNDEENNIDNTNEEKINIDLIPENFTVEKKDFEIKENDQEINLNLDKQSNDNKKSKKHKKKKRKAKTDDNTYKKEKLDHTNNQSKINISFKDIKQNLNSFKDYIAENLFSTDSQEEEKIKEDEIMLDTNSCFYSISNDDETIDSDSSSMLEMDCDIGAVILPSEFAHLTHITPEICNEYKAIAYREGKGFGHYPILLKQCRVPDELIDKYYSEKNVKKIHAYKDKCRAEEDELLARYNEIKSKKRLEAAEEEIMNNRKRVKMDDDYEMLNKPKNEKTNLIEQLPYFFEDKNNYNTDVKNTEELPFPSLFKNEKENNNEDLKEDNNKVNKEKNNHVSFALNQEIFYVKKNESEDNLIKNNTEKDSSVNIDEIEKDIIEASEEKPTDEFNNNVKEIETNLDGDLFEAKNDKSTEGNKSIEILQTKDESTTNLDKYLKPTVLIEKQMEEDIKINHEDTKINHEDTKINHEDFISKTNSEKLICIDLSKENTVSENESSDSEENLIFNSKNKPVIEEKKFIQKNESKPIYVDTTQFNGEKSDVPVLNVNFNDINFTNQTTEIIPKEINYFDDNTNYINLETNSTNITENSINNKISNNTYSPFPLNSNVFTSAKPIENTQNNFMQSNNSQIINQPFPLQNQTKNQVLINNNLFNNSNNFNSIQNGVDQVKSDPSVNSYKEITNNNILNAHNLGQTNKFNNFGNVNNVFANSTIPFNNNLQLNTNVSSINNTKEFNNNGNFLFKPEPMEIDDSFSEASNNSNDKKSMLFSKSNSFSPINNNFNHQINNSNAQPLFNAFGERINNPTNNLTSINSNLPNYNTNNQNFFNNQSISNINNNLNPFVNNINPLNNSNFTNQFNNTGSNMNIFNNLPRTNSLSDRDNTDSSNSDHSNNSSKSNIGSKSNSTIFSNGTNISNVTTSNEIFKIPNKSLDDFNKGFTINPLNKQPNNLNNLFGNNKSNSGSFYSNHNSLSNRSYSNTISNNSVESEGSLSSNSTNSNPPNNLTSGNNFNANSFLPNNLTSGNNFTSNNNNFTAKNNHFTAHNTFGTNGNLAKNFSANNNNFTTNSTLANNFSANNNFTTNSTLANNFSPFNNFTANNNNLSANNNFIDNKNLNPFTSLLQNKNNQNLNTFNNNHGLQQNSNFGQINPQNTSTSNGFFSNANQNSNLNGFFSGANQISNSNGFFSNANQSSNSNGFFSGSNQNSNSAGFNSMQDNNLFNQQNNPLANNSFNQTNQSWQGMHNNTNISKNQGENDENKKRKDPAWNIAYIKK